jgi:uncharacterized OB-fold protein
VSDERKIPAPEIDPETKPYWDAAAEGRLLIKRCDACGAAHHYPRSLCPFCFSDRTRFEEASGKGRIYTFSVMRRSPTGPFAIGYVTLAEGPAMLTNFVGCDFDALAIGQPVRVTFRTAEGGAAVPMFTPDPSGSPDG